MNKTNGLDLPFNTPEKNIAGTQSDKTPFGEPPAISSPETKRIRTTSVGKEPQEKWLTDFTNRMYATGTDNMDEMIVGKKFFDYSKIAHSKQEPLNDQQTATHQKKQSDEHDVLQIIEMSEPDTNDSVQQNVFTSHIPKIYDYSSIQDVGSLSLAKQMDLLRAEQTTHCSIFYKNRHKNAKDFRPDLNALCCDEDLPKNELLKQCGTSSREEQFFVDLQKNNRDISTGSSFDPNDSVLLPKSKIITELTNSKPDRSKTNNEHNDEHTKSSSVYSRKRFAHSPKDLQNSAFATPQLENGLVNTNRDIYDVRHILKKVPGVSKEDLKFFLDEKLNVSANNLRQSNIPAFPLHNESNRTFSVNKDTSNRDKKQKILNFSQFASDAKRKIKFGDRERLVCEISNLKPAAFGNAYKQNEALPILPKANHYGHKNLSFKNDTVPLVQKHLKNPDRKSTHVANLKMYFDEQEDDSKFGDLLSILNEEQIKQQYKLLKRDKRDVAKLKNCKKLAYLSCLERPLQTSMHNHSTANPTATSVKGTERTLRNDAFKHLCTDLCALDSFRF